MLFHPRYSSPVCRRKILDIFSLNYHVPGSLQIEKVICAGRLLSLVLINESKLHSCQTTAKIFICLSLELWPVILSVLLMEQMIAILLHFSTEYQQIGPAAFAYLCKLWPWGAGEDAEQDPCGAPQWPWAVTVLFYSEGCAMFWTAPSHQCGLNPRLEFIWQKKMNC